MLRVRGLGVSRCVGLVLFGAFLPGELLCVFWLRVCRLGFFPLVLTVFKGILLPQISIPTKDC